MQVLQNLYTSLSSLNTLYLIMFSAMPNNLYLLGNTSIDMVQDLFLIIVFSTLCTVTESILFFKYSVTSCNVM